MRSDTLSTVATYATAGMGGAVALLLLFCLVAFWRNPAIPTHWSRTASPILAGVVMLVVGVEMDLFNGADETRQALYSVGFAALLFGLLLLARQIGGTAGRAGDDAARLAVLRERMAMLRQDVK